MEKRARQFVDRLASLVREDAKDKDPVRWFEQLTIEMICGMLEIVDTTGLAGREMRQLYAIAEAYLQRGDEEAWAIAALEASSTLTRLLLHLDATVPEMSALHDTEGPPDPHAFQHALAKVFLDMLDTHDARRAGKEPEAEMTVDDLVHMLDGEWLTLVEKHGSGGLGAAKKTIAETRDPKMGGILEQTTAGGMRNATRLGRRVATKNGWRTWGTGGAGAVAAYAAKQGYDYLRDLLIDSPVLTIGQAYGFIQGMLTTVGRVIYFPTGQLPARNPLPESERELRQTRFAETKLDVETEYSLRRTLYYQTAEEYCIKRTATSCNPLYHTYRDDLYQIKTFLQEVEMLKQLVIPPIEFLIMYGYYRIEKWRTPGSKLGPQWRWIQRLLQGVYYGQRVAWLSVLYLLHPGDLSISRFFQLWDITVPLLAQNPGLAWRSWAITVTTVLSVPSYITSFGFVQRQFPRITTNVERVSNLVSHTAVALPYLMLFHHDWFYNESGLKMTDAFWSMNTPVTWAFYQATTGKSLWGPIDAEETMLRFSAPKLDEKGRPLRDAKTGEVQTTTWSAHLNDAMNLTDAIYGVTWGLSLWAAQPALHDLGLVIRHHVNKLTGDRPGPLWSPQEWMEISQATVATMRDAKQQAQVVQQQQPLSSVEKSAMAEFQERAAQMVAKVKGQFFETASNGQITYNANPKGQQVAGQAANNLAPPQQTIRYTTLSRTEERKTSVPQAPTQTDSSLLRGTSATINTGPPGNPPIPPNYANVGMATRASLRRANPQPIVPRPSRNLGPPNAHDIQAMLAKKTGPLNQVPKKS